MRWDSPLRYPGGKASLAGFLRDVIRENGLDQCVYCEPFAGGAGAALRLLRENRVSTICLNDVDPCIYAFWRAALDEGERFRKKINSVSLDVDEWRRQKTIVEDRAHLSSRTFELGFATFYLNRCSRSGIISGSAPIGGYEQKGPWKIKARFNRKGLAERISWLQEQRQRIRLENKDAIQFLKENVAEERSRSKAFVYLDPPYYGNGRRLYNRYYQEEDHRRLAQYMKEQDGVVWVMSYDKAMFIEKLYGGFVRPPISRQYSLQEKRVVPELVIAPSHVRLPVCKQETGLVRR